MQNKNTRGGSKVREPYHLVRISDAKVFVVDQFSDFCSEADIEYNPKVASKFGELRKTAIEGWGYKKSGKEIPRSSFKGFIVDERPYNRHNYESECTVYKWENSSGSGTFYELDDVANHIGISKQSVSRFIREGKPTKCGTKIEKEEVKYFDLLKIR
jgi:hypothetical protein